MSQAKLKMHRGHLAERSQLPAAPHPCLGISDHSRRLARGAELALGPLLFDTIIIGVCDVLAVDHEGDKQGRREDVLIEFAAMGATRDLVVRRVVGLVLGL